MRKYAIYTLKYADIEDGKTKRTYTRNHIAFTCETGGIAIELLEENYIHEFYSLPEAIYTSEVE